MGETISRRPGFEINIFESCLWLLDPFGLFFEVLFGLLIVFAFLLFLALTFILLAAFISHCLNPFLV